mgnify:CR=1 FL=1
MQENPKSPGFKDRAGFCVEAKVSPVRTRILSDEMTNLPGSGKNRRIPPFAPGGVLGRGT